MKRTSVFRKGQYVSKLLSPTSNVYYRSPDKNPHCMTRFHLRMLHCLHCLQCNLILRVLELDCHMNVFLCKYHFHMLQNR